MKEDILQYIWKFKYYNAQNLVCANGKELQVLYPGVLNVNQGADFTEAKIKINDTTWVGSIEIHVQSSHWNVHRHSGDSNFANVILHVVWQHDMEIKDVSGNDLPVLELQSRVSGLLLNKYRDLMKYPVFIPCENQLHDLHDLTLHHWKQRLVVERLLEKSKEILKSLEKANHHWEEVFWWYIAANFGLKVNSTVFALVAQSLPIPILARHKHSLLQLEAMLFGQAGLLEGDIKDNYALMLRNEYRFLQKKYGLIRVEGRVHFLRMRPANFPTLRLAQLAQLIFESQHIFSKIKESVSVNEVKNMFDVKANDYWNYHYVFDKETEFKEKRSGRQMTENIVINTIVPVLFAYGLQKNEESYKEKALAWLENISPEKNQVTRGFLNLHFKNKNAFDSQALIQLKNEYCNYKRCLECAIGNGILKKSFS